MAITFGNISKRLSFYKKDRNTRDFIAHNLKTFNARPISRNGGPEILFELNAVSVSHIAYSYLANVLAHRHGAQIKAYSPYGSSSMLRRLDRKISQFFSVGEFGVYKSFGTSGFLQPILTQAQRTRARKIAGEIAASLRNKTDIEGIVVDGVLLGDLVYDTFLRDFSKPTIELTDPDFRRFLVDAIEAYIFWNDYFDSHDVRAVNASHCVYLHAIPLRIALNRGIDAYQINATHAYKMSGDRPFAYTDFVDYHEDFMALPADIRNEGLAEAKRRVDLRFSGKVGVDMHYSTKSAYGDFKEHRLLKESPRIKVLVATHCFFDSPHSFGNNLFPDFYEWLDFLGKMTEETDYDWYIKTHPDYWPGTKEIIDSFVEKYPKLVLLSADSSHHQIIAEGINFALTCYGTIGFEYAALGVPVINASLNNPHIAYGFNRHPQNVTEYGELLRNLDSFKMNIKVEDVYEFYFMSRIHNTENWLFQDYARMEEEIGGYGYIGSPVVYRSWLNEWSEEHHDTVMNGLDNFVGSKSFRLSYKHIQPASGRHA